MTWFRYSTWHFDYILKHYLNSTGLLDAACSWKVYGRRDISSPSNDFVEKSLYDHPVQNKFQTSALLKVQLENKICIILLL